MPINKGEGLRLHVHVGLVARVGVADLCVAALDEQPVIPITGWLIREGEGDDGALLRKRGSVELDLAPGPQGESRVGMFRGDDGKYIALDVKTGDKVLFGKWSGTEVKVDGAELLIMKESDIMGIIE